MRSFSKLLRLYNLKVKRETVGLTVEEAEELSELEKWLEKGGDFYDR